MTKDFCCCGTSRLQSPLLYIPSTFVLVYGQQQLRQGTPRETKSRCNYILNGVRRLLQVGRMRRSSSKLITRARSVRHVGKVPFKFSFDFLIETVDRIAASGEIVVVWEKSNTKLECTKPARIDRNTRKASFEKERISAEVTLFKTQPSDRKFQDKVVKLAVRSGGADGKTLAKIHLNLAEYAEVPSGSKRISAELTNGSILISTIQCQFLSMGKSTPAKAGTRSDGAADGSTDEDDPEDEGRESGSSSMNEDTSSMFSKNKLKLSRQGSRKVVSRVESRPRNDENVHDLSNTDHGSEKLRKENMRLKKLLDEADRGSGDGGKLGEENRSLRNEIRELKTALAREPVYADVVKELKEAKMALALLHLEKEKTTLELMNLKREIGRM